MATTHPSSITADGPLTTDSFLSDQQPLSWNFPFNTFKSQLPNNNNNPHPLVSNFASHGPAIVATPQTHQRHHSLSSTLISQQTPPPVPFRRHTENNTAKEAISPTYPSPSPTTTGRRPRARLSKLPPSASKTPYLFTERDGTVSRSSAETFDSRRPRRNSASGGDIHKRDRSRSRSREVIDRIRSSFDFSLDFPSLTLGMPGRRKTLVENEDSGAGNAGVVAAVTDLEGPVPKVVEGVLWGRGGPRRLRRGNVEQQPQQQLGNRGKKDEKEKDEKKDDIVVEERGRKRNTDEKKRLSFLSWTRSESTPRSPPVSAIDVAPMLSPINYKVHTMHIIPQSSTPIVTVVDPPAAPTPPPSSSSPKVKKALRNVWRRSISKPDIFSSTAATPHGFNKMAMKTTGDLQLPLRPPPMSEHPMHRPSYPTSPKMLSSSPPPPPPPPPVSSINNIYNMNMNPLGLNLRGAASHGSLVVPSLSNSLSSTSTTSEPVPIPRKSSRRAKQQTPHSLLHPHPSLLTLSLSPPELRIREDDASSESVLEGPISPYGVLSPYDGPHGVKGTGDLDGAGAPTALDKVLVRCCRCSALHDVPGDIYTRLLEDVVGCPWCRHEMRRTCCAGYRAAVYLGEKLY